MNEASCTQPREERWVPGRGHGPGKEERMRRFNQDSTWGVAGEKQGREFNREGLKASPLGQEEHFEIYIAYT